MGIFAWPAVAATASAAMLWFGTGLTPLWWLTWIACIPVLSVSPRVAAPVALGAAMAAWTAGGFNQWSYYRLLGMPWTVAILAPVVPALVFGLAVAVWRSFAVRGDAMRAALGYASVWVCYEFAAQKLSVHSTFGNIAYSQMNFLPVVQVASVAGVTGIAFLLFFVPGSLVALTASAEARRSRLRCLGIVATLAAGVLGWGAWRLAQPVPGPRIQIGLAASDIPRNLRPAKPAQIAETFAQYAQVSEDLIAAGARLVVLPEKDAILSAVTTGQADQTFGQTARQGAFLALGVERWTPDAKLNEIRIYSPSGNLAATYEKHHMLPAFEGNLLPGTALITLRAPTGEWGLQICKDMDFPALSREYAARGVGLMIVPAWDFNMDGWYHAGMAILRGVESGFSVVRAPKQGVLTVSDSRGRVLASRRTSSADFATLLASVPVHHDQTIYSLWGDWFGWLNVALLAGLALSLVKGSQSRRHAVSPESSTKNAVA